MPGAAPAAVLCVSIINTNLLSSQLDGSRAPPHTQLEVEVSLPPTPAQHGDAQVRQLQQQCDKLCQQVHDLHEQLTAAQQRSQELEQRASEHQQQEQQYQLQIQQLQEEQMELERSVQHQSDEMQRWQQHAEVIQ